MTEHDLPRVKDVIEETLIERCGDVFELIAVRPDFNEYGDEILVIKAIFNEDRLGVQRTSGLIRHLRPKLAEVGTEAPTYPSGHADPRLVDSLLFRAID